MTTTQERQTGDEADASASADTSASADASSDAGASQATNQPRLVGLARPGLHLSRPAVRRWRLWLIARGLAGLVLGGLILFQPGLSIDALAPLVGIFFCAIGLLRIVAGAADSEYATAIRVANVAFGLILVALGALAIRYPVAGLLFTVMTVGFAWMMEGAVSLAFLPARHQGRGWVIGFAVISLLAGLTLILWPASSLLPLVIVVGAFLLVGGVVDLLNAATLKPGVNLPAME